MQFEHGAETKFQKDKTRITRTPKEVLILAYTVECEDKNNKSERAVCLKNSLNIQNV